MPDDNLYCKNCELIEEGERNGTYSEKNLKCSVTGQYVDPDALCHVPTETVAAIAKQMTIETARRVTGDKSVPKKPKAKAKSTKEKG